MVKKLKYCIFLIATWCFTNINAQVGINTITPLSTLDVNGNVSLKVLTLNGTNTGGGGTATLINDGVYISVRPLATDDKFQLPDPTLFSWENLYH